MLDRILIGSSSEPTDTNFKNVTLLLHGDGSNGAQNNTFIDSSTNNFTISRNGNTTQGSFSPYGSNWSLYFGGNASAGNGDHIYFNNQSAFSFGTGDFTIEGWIFYQPTGDLQLFMDWRPYLTTGAYPLLYIDTSGNMIYDANGTVITGGSVAANTWNHFALSRSGTSTKLFVNGVQSGSTYSDSNNYAVGSLRPLLGSSGYYPGSLPFKGYLSNVRILKGTALYTANFTPPTQPLTAITNTSALICSSNRFRDASANNFTVNKDNNVKVTNFAPFAPSSAYSTTTNGGSAYFDGNDYLNYSQTAITGNFTLEHWFYLTSTDNEPYMFGNQISGIQTEVKNGNIIVYYAPGFLISTTGGNVTPNQWYHVAVVRNGSTTTLYLNGVNVGSTTTSYTMSAATFYIGTASTAVGNSAYSTNGYITDCRIVTSAVYTSNFTPPTAPLTSITNTSFLLNATNAAIFDNSMKNDLETVGNAQISTSVKKFGTGSMYFDGSGDGIYFPSTVSISSGDFTIECWYYTGSATNQSLFSIQTTTSSGYAAARVDFEGSTSKLYMLISTGGGSWAINAGSSSTVASNTWTHIALVRSGSNFTLYINGTSAATGTSSSSLFSSALSYVGCTNNGSVTQSVNGYIDDFRMTAGVARYTANFTAPTAPFPNK